MKTSKSKTKKLAKILDGEKLAKEIKLDLAQKIFLSKQKPGLATILIGDDPASLLYVNLKEKEAGKVGINFHKYLCNQDCYQDISEKELLTMIKFLNEDPGTNGIIVQLPLPEKYHTQKIINAVDPGKDVDGFHPKNKEVIPPTIFAIIELLRSTKEKLENKKTLIIGKSSIFINGLESYIQKELKIKNLKQSNIIPNNSKDYDIIIIAIGQAKALKKTMIKDGAIIIDVGINKLHEKTIGDADPKVTEVASYFSPVPGGVGPLTVACLLKNTYLLSKKK
ncbi:MAG: tetrahydrofolate dehydrogenase/cyclohydrolase catalytic domain-containing protein [Patescibacteria group bacterium]|jgi:methylenetetrahydrofolate dehydrogenase (NADP+)/methenyltetrahydrofolate cyclohydrolase